MSLVVVRVFWLSNLGACGELEGGMAGWCFCCTMGEYDMRRTRVGHLVWRVGKGVYSG